MRRRGEPPEQDPQFVVSDLDDAVIVTEDQHFEEHWGVDLPRVLQAAWRNAPLVQVTGLVVGRSRGMSVSNADSTATLPPPTLERHILLDGTHNFMLGDLRNELLLLIHEHRERS